jgi:hypothetical protein
MTINRFVKLNQNMNIHSLVSGCHFKVRLHVRFKVRFSHRYRKFIIDWLRFVMCPLLTPHFFTVAINSTNEANKAGGMCH